jgi:hypothetical protein
VIVAGGGKWLILGMTSSADHLERRTTIIDKLRPALSQNTHFHGTPLYNVLITARVNNDLGAVNWELWDVRL